MKLYISGPMTGLPNNNARAFNHVAKALRKAGYVVFNPAETTHLPSFDGWRFAEELETNNEAIRAANLSEPQRRIWLRDDIIALSKCDAIVLLPGWEGSRGAWAELYWADAVKMKEYYWENKRHRDRLLFPTAAQATSPSSPTGTPPA